MNRIYRSEVHRQEWLERGYSRFPLLSRSEAAELLVRLDAEREASCSQPGAGRHIKSGCHSSMEDGDLGYRRRAFEIVRSVFAPRLEPILDDYQIIIGGTFLKSPGAVEVPPHADWVFTENPADVSLNVWCPLIDVDDSNSTLRLLEGSHRIIAEHICAPRTANFWTGYEQVLRDESTPMELGAGEAVIFDSNVVHSSRPNMSNGRRPAIAFICVPSSSRPAIYKPDPEGRRFQVFDMSGDAFFDHSSAELFNGEIRSPSLGYVPDRNRPVSESEFRRHLRNGPALRRRMLSRREERPGKLAALAKWVAGRR
ncbi:MAG TPA: phytanoyl-CoA dioxygenase family protein [Allosphingosinicella sp.]|nr:phytanoyl-CoA dioxygenase family protein [Allosphingosinicella sp.]